MNEKRGISKVHNLEIPSANGPAYEKNEIRVGPPLEYVGGKMRSSLDSLRNAYRALTGAEGDAGEQVRLNVYAAFKYQLTAFLALYNMLTLANDHLLADRLLQGEESTFDDWLDRIVQEGSVTG